MKKDTFIDLLDAEWQRSCALLMMQVSMEDGDFEGAMDSQLWYLYWCDEFHRLYRRYEKKYWTLRFSTKGVKW